jgi:hypothetical protein
MDGRMSGIRRERAFGLRWTSVCVVGRKRGVWMCLQMTCVRKVCVMYEGKEFVWIVCMRSCFGCARVNGVWKYSTHVASSRCRSPLSPFSAVFLPVCVGVCRSGSEYPPRLRRPLRVHASSSVSPSLSSSSFWRDDGYESRMSRKNRWCPTSLNCLRCSRALSRRVSVSDGAGVVAACALPGRAERLRPGDWGTQRLLQLGELTGVRLVEDCWRQ